MSAKVITAGIVVWMVALLGGWMLMSGGSEPQDKRAATASQSETSTAERSAQTQTQTQPAPKGEAVRQTDRPTETQPADTVGQLSDEAAADAAAHPEMSRIDPADGDPELAARERARHERYALFMLLPYDADGYHLDVTDLHKGGRAELTMRYPGTLAQAKRRYQQVLDKANDTGQAYDIVYEKR